MHRAPLSQRSCSLDDACSRRNAEQPTVPSQTGGGEEAHFDFDYTEGNAERYCVVGYSLLAVGNIARILIDEPRSLSAEYVCVGDIQGTALRADGAFSLSDEVFFLACTFTLMSALSSAEAACFFLITVRAVVMKLGRR